MWAETICEWALRSQVFYFLFFIQLIEAKKEAFNKELSSKRSQLTKEEADALMEQHKQELEFLSRSMVVEKQRQLASLSEKIAERKKRKAAALEQRHKAEMAKELINQQEERQKIEDDKVRISLVYKHNTVKSTNQNTAPKNEVDIKRSKLMRWQQTL